MAIYWRLLRWLKGWTVGVRFIQMAPRNIEFHGPILYDAEVGYVLSVWGITVWWMRMATDADYGPKP